MRKQQDRKQAAPLLLVAASAVALDQWSKSCIRANPYPVGLLPGFLNIVYIENRGAAFGLLVNQTFLITVTIAILSVIIVLLIRYPYLATTPTLISAGLIFGGATGNLVDRLRFGYVIDFIDVRLWNDFHWPAFNFADSAIVIGAFILAYSLYQLGLYRKVHDHDHRTQS
jgi:signal peptidase II